MSQEYNVIWGHSIIALVEHLNIYLDKGWQCQGGVCVATFPNPSPNSKGEFVQTFYQAVVRELKETKPNRGSGF